MRQRIIWYRYIRQTKPWGIWKSWKWAGIQVRGGYRL